MIKFSSVSKYFPPDTPAIDDISFEIDPGELVLLTGPSGSGKTTIMKLLTKEYSPTDGSILFSAKTENENKASDSKYINLNEIKKSKIHEHRRKIGVIFQDYKLLPELNIWENIALPLSIIGKQQSEIEQRVTDLLTLVSLTEKAFLFPKQLSGGEAQRISIARALSTGPSIVFADEPTGNLDRETSLEIGKLIQKINSLGTTIIFATHDRDIIDLFKNTRHINLNKGKIESDTKKPENATKTKESKSSETKKILVTNKKPGFWSRIFGKKKTSIAKADKKTEEEKPPKKESKKSSTRLKSTTKKKIKQKKL